MKRSEALLSKVIIGMEMSLILIRGLLVTLLMVFIKTFAVILKWFKLANRVS